MHRLLRRAGRGVRASRVRSPRRAPIRPRHPSRKDHEMHVIMRVPISGHRNGEAWPPVGDSIDLPDDEAAQLVANGYAIECDPPAVDDGPAESAPAVTDPAPAPSLVKTGK